MNFSQLGRVLNMSRSGARTLVLRNEKKIKKYIIYENKKPIGVNDESIEILRNLCVKTPSLSNKRDSEINMLKLEIDFKDKLINEKDKNYDLLLSQFNDLKDLNTKLNAELDYYRSRGLFARLLGYKPKQ